MGELYSRLKLGMEEAIAFAEGKDTGAKVHRPFQVDVKEVRQKTGMTEEKFAATFGIGLGTLRQWERGDKKPKGAALILLNLLAKDPQVVLRVLQSG